MKLSLSLSDFENADRIVDTFEAWGALRRKPDNRPAIEAVRRLLANAFAELRKEAT